MTEERKKSLFFQLATEKMKSYRSKEIFYRALGLHCGRSMRTAQRWVDGEKWPDGDEQLRRMWDFFDYELLDNGDVEKKKTRGSEKTRPFHAVSAQTIDAIVRQVPVIFTSFSSAEGRLQRAKMDEAMEVLKKRELIKSEEQVAREHFGVDDETFQGWVAGKLPLGLMGKKTFAHDFDIPMFWWDDRTIPLENVIGKGLGKDEPEFHIPVKGLETETGTLNAINEILVEHRKRAGG